MKTHFLKVFFIAWLLTAAFFSGAQYQKKDFTKLFQITGKWKTITGNIVLYDIWEKADENSIYKKTYKVTAGDSSLIEVSAIIFRDEQIYYLPTIDDENGKPQIKYKLLKIQNDTFLFKNLSKNYPAHVAFSIPKNNTLTKWIDGISKGKYKKTIYIFRKTD